MPKLIAKLKLDDHGDQIEIYESFFGTYYEIKSSKHDRFMFSTRNLHLALKHSIKFSEKGLCYNAELGEFYEKAYSGVFK